MKTSEIYEKMNNILILAIKYGHEKYMILSQEIFDLAAELSLEKKEAEETD